MKGILILIQTHRVVVVPQGVWDVGSHRIRPLHNPGSKRSFTMSSQTSYCSDYSYCVIYPLIEDKKKIKVSVFNCVLRCYIVTCKVCGMKTGLTLLKIVTTIWAKYNKYTKTDACDDQKRITL